MDHIEELADKKEVYRFCLLLMLITAVMVAPLAAMVAFKWPLITDMLAFSSYIHHFSSQFWHGEWYPRWLMEVNSGYGSPVFLYYPPLTFFVMTLFQWLSPLDPHGFARMVLGMWLALVLSGATSYYWLRRHFPEAQARQGALLYAGFPYLFTIIYFGYAISHLFAVALYPLLLLSIDRLRAQGWRGVPMLAAAFCLLCLAQLPLLVTFLPVAIAYAIFIANKKERVRQLFMVACSGLCGIGLSAVYLLPMLLNLSSIHSESYYRGALNYMFHFVTMRQLYAFSLMVLPLVLLCAEQPAGQRRLTPAARFWIVMLALLFFLSVPFSRWMWDNSLALQMVQAPWRFCISMIPGAVFLSLSWLPAARSRYAYHCLFLFMMTLTILVWQHDFSASRESMARMPFAAVGFTGEYQTRWMDETHVDTPTLPSGPQQADFIEGRGSIRVEQWSPRQIRLHADITSDHARLWVHRFYFPGWVGERVVPYHGLMSFALMRGAHEVTLSLPEFTGESAGRHITLGTIMILTCWRIRQKHFATGVQNASA